MSETTPLSFFEEDVTEEINHGIRVSNLVYYVGKELGLYENQCYELAVARHGTRYRKALRIRLSVRTPRGYPEDRGNEVCPDAPGVLATIC